MILNITPYSIVGNFDAVGEPSRTEQLKNLKKNKKKRAKPKQSLSKNRGKKNVRNKKKTKK